MWKTLRWFSSEPAAHAPDACSSASSATVNEGDVVLVILGGYCCCFCFSFIRRAYWLPARGKSTVSKMTSQGGTQFRICSAEQGEEQRKEYYPSRKKHGFSASTRVHLSADTENPPCPKRNKHTLYTQTTNKARTQNVNLLLDNHNRYRDGNATQDFVHVPYLTRSPVSGANVSFHGGGSAVWLPSE